ncbi:hypothetical protein AAFX91_33015 [Bradyrhizobium sp. 31Argb]
MVIGNSLGFERSTSIVRSADEVAKRFLMLIVIDHQVVFIVFEWRIQAGV